MEIARTIEIARPVAEVQAYVSDPLNDPEWCPKVISVAKRVDEEGAYDVVHRPVRLLAPRQMLLRVLSIEEELIVLEESDGVDSFKVCYELAGAGPRRTSMTQRSQADVGVPRVLHPIWRLGIGRDVATQLRRLRAVLESCGGAASALS